MSEFNGAKIESLVRKIAEQDEETDVSFYEDETVYVEEDN